MKIRIYYHVTMMNHYLEITEYILNKAQESGLLAACDGFYIGALGEPDELLKLQELISKYPKAQIRAHSERKMSYEFHTLRFLKEDADNLPTHYQVYVHSKSVSYPKEGDPITGKRPDDFRWDFFWMQWMVFNMVTQWDRWYKALSLKGWGYDIAACRVVPARLSASSRVHSSGNMWAANSDYIKTLSTDIVAYTDYKDIFEAEMFAFSGSIQKSENELVKRTCGYPIIYIMSQMFSDAFPYEKDFDTYIKTVTNFNDYAI